MVKLHRDEDPTDTIARLSTALRLMTEKFDQAEQRRSYWKAKAEAHGSCPCNIGTGTDGPDEHCPEHGRTYGEWVERGDILAVRLAKIRDIASVTRYCAGGPCMSNHMAEIRAILFGEAEPNDIETPPPSPFGNDFECCASGRCEVCTPGFVWGRDG